MKKNRNSGKEILKGLKEIKAWQRGEKKLKTTRLALPEASDVSKIRHKLGLSQEEFANFMGVSVATLRNWEQGRREPDGSAKSLLMIAKKAPNCFIEAFEINKPAQFDISVSKLINENEAAKLICKSVFWLRRDRCLGGLIPFRKLGQSVRYDMKDLIEWINKHPLQTSTSK